MYCSYCGKEIRNPNQSYCSDCGSEIQINHINFQNQTRTNSQITQNSIKEKINFSDQYIIKNQSKLYPPQSSLRYLILPLVSFILPIIIFIIVAGFYINDDIYYSPIGYLFSIHPSFNSILVKMLALMNLFGLIFGTKLKKYPENNLEKCGKILGIFGIIINGLAIASIFSPILRIWFYF